MVRKFPPFRSERKKRSTSEGTPQFPNGISGKLPYHLTSNRNFRIFWPNGKHPLCFCTAYRREFLAFSKVSCFPFLNCFGSFLLDIIFLPSLPREPCILCYLHLDPRRYIPPKQAIYFSRKPLTYPGSASVDCTGELSICFRKHTPSNYPNECQLLDSMYCYHENRMHVLLLLWSYFEQL